MARLLAIRSVTEQEAEAIVADLSDKYPDYEFEFKPHETRFEINVLNTTTQTKQTDIDKMARTAKGGDPIVEKPKA